VEQAVLLADTDEEFACNADILGIVEEELADTAVKLACNADILGIAEEELADTVDSHEEYQ
jgi:hypothetical protein